MIKPLDDRVPLHSLHGNKVVRFILSKPVVGWRDGRPPTSKWQVGLWTLHYHMYRHTPSLVGSNNRYSSQLRVGVSQDGIGGEGGEKGVSDGRVCGLLWVINDCVAESSLCFSVCACVGVRERGECVCVRERKREREGGGSVCMCVCM